MDIEDLHRELEPPRLQLNIGAVKARFKTNKTRNGVSLADELQISSDVPEKHRIFVQTWGCTHNTSDSEYMAGLLAHYGYSVTLGGSQSSKVDGASSSRASDKHFCDCSLESGDSCCRHANLSSDTRQSAIPYTDEEAKQQADLWILNSCTVKGPAEDHFRNAVLTGTRKGKRLVVAGCVPQSRPGVDYLKGVSVIGVQQIDRVVEVVEETLRGNTVRFLDKKWAVAEDGSAKRHRLGGAPLDLPKIRRNPLIEILAVSTGCLNSCTYCKTKHARGVLASYPIEQLLRRAEQAFADGVKELWLTSEDLGAYGRDLDRASSDCSCSSLANRFPHYLTLADLLAGLVRLIPAGCMLRLGMTNPPYILEQLQEVADVLNHPRVYSFLHVPVQSGSDAVLERMNREYTVEDFSHVVSFLQERVKAPPLPPFTDPGAVNGCGSLTIATDIICGFPNETETDFDETVRLIERFHFPVLYINQFFARPGTPAASMPRKATTADVKKRTRRLHDLFRTYMPYTGRVGAEVRVLVTEISHDGRFWVGHTKAYEQVLVPKLPHLMGRIVLVRITECDKFFMRSDLIDPGPFDSLVFTSQFESTSSPLLPSLPELTRSAKPQLAQAKQPNTRNPTKTSDPNWVLRFGAILLLVYFALKLCESRGFFNWALSK